MSVRGDTPLKRREERDRGGGGAFERENVELKRKLAKKERKKRPVSHLVCFYKFDPPHNSPKRVLQKEKERARKKSIIKKTEGRKTGKKKRKQSKRKENIFPGNERDKWLR